MIQIDTENSSYEIDMANKRIRRLHGSAPATPRMSVDGEHSWKSYVALSSMLTEKPFPVPGETLLISWEPQEDLRGHTITSRVKRVITIREDPY